MPSMQPSDTAPSARIEASLTSQSSDVRLCFSRGKRTGRSASWKTLESTSKAAAEHFLRFQSDKASLISLSSSESSESAPPSVPLLPSSAPPWVLALWNLGLMSESLSGICWSSSVACLGGGECSVYRTIESCTRQLTYSKHQDVQIGVFHSIEKNGHQPVTTSWSTLC